MFFCLLTTISFYHFSYCLLSHEQYIKTTTTLVNILTKVVVVFCLLYVLPDTFYNHPVTLDALGSEVNNNLLNIQLPSYTEHNLLFTVIYKRFRIGSNHYWITTLLSLSLAAKVGVAVLASSVLLALFAVI